MTTTSIGTSNPTPAATLREPGDAMNAGPSDAHTGDDLLQRVVQGAHDTIDRLAESAAPHVRSLQDGVYSAREMLHTRSGEAREMGSEWAESLRCTVRDHPIAAVATALAIGALVVRLSR